MSQPIRDQGGHICWRIDPSNRKFVEDGENLLPVKFRKDSLGGCIEKSKSSQPIIGVGSQLC